MGHARTRSARAAARLVHRHGRNAHSSVTSWVTPGPAPRGPPPASFTAMAATLTRPSPHGSRPDPLRAGRRPPRSPPWPQRSLVRHLMGHARTRSARAAARLVHRHGRNAHSSVISWVTSGPVPRVPIASRSGTAFRRHGHVDRRRHWSRPDPSARHWSRPDPSARHWSRPDPSARHWSRPDPSARHGSRPDRFRAGRRPRRPAQAPGRTTRSTALPL